MSFESILDTDSRLLGLDELKMRGLTNTDLCDPAKVPPFVKPVVELRSTLFQMFGPDWMARVTADSLNANSWGIGEHLSVMLTTSESTLNLDLYLDQLRKSLCSVLDGADRAAMMNTPTLPPSHKLSPGRLLLHVGPLLQSWTTALGSRLASEAVLSAWAYIHARHTGYPAMFPAVRAQLLLLKK